MRLAHSSGLFCSVLGQLLIKVMLPETIRNDDF